jgi:L-seryl-tRNA(Ser) seleniumtransferase
MGFASPAVDALRTPAKVSAIDERTRRALAAIPSVNEVLQHPLIEDALESLPRQVVVDSVRATLDGLRRDVLGGRLTVPPSVDELASAAEAAARARMRRTLRRVINATGVVLHTGLGRAVMGAEAAAAAADVISSHSNLAIDPETGRRGSRDTHVAHLLTYLTGAESATVVNNNAASLMLILNTIAEGKEVVVSRGELVEIGGSFRLPDVVRRSGAILREVGTTNKTHLRDYQEAITENTAALLKVHQSNYKIVGFAQQVGLEDLVRLGHRHGLPVVEDLGSGALVDLSAYGLPQEPMVQASVRAGADLVCFSGDKLLGGPQAGVILGRCELIEALKRNPLVRVLRCDKVTVAMLEATLRLYMDPETVVQRIPPLRILTRSPGEIEAKARALLSLLSAQARERLAASVEPATSEIGGGSLPGEELPTYVLALRPQDVDADALARWLRTRDLAIYPRVSKDAVLFDLRTVLNGEVEEIAATLNALVASGGVLA